MKTVTVAAASRSYPIHIGRGLLGRGDLLAPHIGSDQVMVVTNQTVGPLYLGRLERALAPRPPRVLELPDGEEHKTLAVLERVFDALLEARFNRDCTLLALGGGVVGDLGGFAAACYQRGVDFVQLPTTLLAQVDSSVGGKTAVNHRLGKNMIGAFHQPVCVVADTDTLSTLGERELRSGLAEVIKYGLIRDADFLAWTEAHLADLLARDPEALAVAIERSCRIKAEVVGADELEHGERAILNLGHTFGHAIESGLGYGAWRHGEAVAAGLVLAADLSARLGWIGPEAVARVEALIGAAGLPVRAPRELGADRMLELMAVDKKARAGRLRLVLLRALGAAALCDDVDAGALRATLELRREAA